MRTAGFNVGTHDDPRYIPQLSAVMTNVRHAAADRVARCWYQLPPLTDRHRPALLLARVNNRHPRTLLNYERRAVVDANFCTLWPTTGATVDVYALLPALNSTWCAAVLELTGTVMGGGALTVEAAHMRRVPLPQLPDAVWQQLSALGRRLAVHRPPAATLTAIDALFFAAMGFADPETVRAEVSCVAAQRLRARSA